jgi:hypothetical protein
MIAVPNGLAEVERDLITPQRRALAAPKRAVRTMGRPLSLPGPTAARHAPEAGDEATPKPLRQPG